MQRIFSDLTPPSIKIAGQHTEVEKDPNNNRRCSSCSLSPGALGSEEGAAPHFSVCNSAHSKASPQCPRRI